MENNKFVIPVAIVLAGALVAGALYFSKNPSSNANYNAKADQSATNTKPKDIVIKPVSADDHILGKVGAKLTVIEYSDTECPYCKLFHGTMRKIMSDYGKSGDVAWVYRHFPIVGLHSKAPKEAQATECAAEQGGNDKFWAYVNKIYDLTPSNDGLDPLKLYEIANSIGLDSAKFTTCLESGKYAAKVQADYDSLYNSGINPQNIGTPYNIIVTSDGQKYSIPGALPYADMKTQIDNLLKAK